MNDLFRASGKGTLSSAIGKQLLDGAWRWRQRYSSLGMAILKSTSAQLHYRHLIQPAPSGRICGRRRPRYRPLRRAGCVVHRSATVKKGCTRDKRRCGCGVSGARCPVPSACGYSGCRVCRSRGRVPSGRRAGPSERASSAVPTSSRTRSASAESRKSLIRTGPPCRRTVRRLRRSREPETA